MQIHATQACFEPGSSQTQTQVGRRKQRCRCLHTPRVNRLSWAHESSAGFHSSPQDMTSSFSPIALQRGRERFWPAWIVNGTQPIIFTSIHPQPATIPSRCPPELNLTYQCRRASNSQPNCLPRQKGFDKHYPCQADHGVQLI